MVLKGVITLKENKTNNLKVGKILAALRVSKGITQEDLAARCGISTQSLSSIENDHHVPSLETFIFIAFALEMKFSELSKMIEQDINLHRIHEEYIESKVRHDSKQK
jgi:transcriptional regulator with XRE-family HTH domain